MSVRRRDLSMVFKRFSFSDLNVFDVINLYNNVKRFYILHDFYRNYVKAWLVIEYISILLQKVYFHTY